MHTAGSAHEESLPIAHLIKSLDGQAPSLVIDEVVSYMMTRSLGHDIEASLVFSDGERKVQFEAFTPYGHDILEEIVFSDELLPCKSGDCEFAGVSCTWCGRSKH